jgi:two-component sensor histidine kinase
VGLANKSSDYDDSDILQVSLLMDAVWKVVEQKQAEDRIVSLLAEKDIILKEVHHRIKNNMGTVHGLLLLQAESTTVPAAAAVLRDAGNRVQSMMLLYDRLYRSEHYGDLALRDFFKGLLNQIVGNFPHGDRVRIVERVGDFHLPAQKMQPLGIIINELITNIMKYAFVGRSAGQISVSASQEGQRVTIVIQDDGIGIPESVDIENSTGFGMTLIDLLTTQLNGTIRFERVDGTRVTLVFDL